MLGLLCKKVVRRLRLEQWYMEEILAKLLKFYWEAPGSVVGHRVQGAGQHGELTSGVRANGGRDGASVQVATIALLEMLVTESLKSGKEQSRSTTASSLLAWKDSRSVVESSVYVGTSENPCLGRRLQGT